MNNDLSQYEVFGSAVDSIMRDRENMLRQLMKLAPHLRDYLMIHSVFSINAYKDNFNVCERDKKNWIEGVMLQVLMPTDEDIKRLHAKEYVPDDIMKKTRYIRSRTTWS